MRHITQIWIQGFQSHANTLIELDPGVNAITGPSDNGKSAILRALRWVLWNQAPEGEWIRKGCDHATVEVTFSDGLIITRERIKGRNKYTVAPPDGETITLVDFGRQVPAEVLRAHGMIPVAFDPDRPSLLNLATQLEPPFFLTDSAPVRARTLGRLAGVHVIDAAQRGTASDLRSRTATIAQTEVEIGEIDVQLEPYADLDESERRVARVEGILAELGPVTERLGAARSATAQLAAIDLARAEVAGILQRTRHADAAAALVAEAATSIGTRTKLAGIQARAATVETQIGQTGQVLLRLEGVPQAEAALIEAAEVEAKLRDIRRIAGVKAQIVASWSETRANVKRLQSVPDADARTTAAVTIHETLQRLGAWRATLRRIDQERTALTRTVAAAVQREEAGGRVVSIEAGASRLARLSDLHGRLRQLDARLGEERTDHGRASRELVDASQEYARVLKEAGVCPTCGQPVTDHAIIHAAAGVQEEETEHVG